MVVHADVGEDDAVDDDEVSVFADGAVDADDFVVDDFGGEVEGVGVAVYGEEGGGAGFVFEFDEAVAVAGGAYVGDDADELYVFHVASDAVDGYGVHDFSSLALEDFFEDSMPVFEEFSEVLGGAFAGAFAGDVFDEGEFGVVFFGEWFPSFGFGEIGFESEWCVGGFLGGGVW